MGQFWNELFPGENGVRLGDVLLSCWTANGEGITVNGVYKDTRISKINIRNHLNKLVELKMVTQVYKKHTLIYFITDSGIEAAKSLNSIKNISN